MDFLHAKRLILFLSTPSGWRATTINANCPGDDEISIHALRVEGDITLVSHPTEIAPISIHALRVEGDGKAIWRKEFRLTISIHALRVEGDRVSVHVLRDYVEISIHALRVEGDKKEPSGSVASMISIHALRVEGDEQFPEYEDLALLISIHALRVEGDLATPIETPLTPDISIHALRVEGDLSCGDRRAGVRPISIHALRVEGDDTCSMPPTRRSLNFYPRPPGGGRHDMLIEQANDQEFLSTPSGWRATGAGARKRTNPAISIHALRVEGDGAGGHHYG